METEIMALLKTRAQAQGLTQGEIAQRLGLSLPTIKRWYAGKGLRISNLRSLCDLLGLSLSEAFLMVENKQRGKFTYTPRQERALVRDERLLAFFDLIVSGVSVSLIKSRYHLEDKEITSYLLALDKIGLIELRTGHRFRLVNEGEPTWIQDGPLSLRFRQEMITDFLGNHEKTQMSFFLHDYLPEDKATIELRLKDLLHFMEESNKRSALRPQDAVSSGAYVSMRDFEWNLRSLLKK